MCVAGAYINHDFLFHPLHAASVYIKMGNGNLWLAGGAV